ncbi:MAG TPA: hypothetical protein VHM24_01180 [Gemmatimonadaceae bacterium]|nr:hypothetical protein [Gemmatimonadaceae bacterium]
MTTGGGAGAGAGSGAGAVEARGAHAAAPRTAASEVAEANLVVIMYAWSSLVKLLAWSIPEVKAVF